MQGFLKQIKPTLILSYLRIISMDYNFKFKYIIVYMSCSTRLLPVMHVHHIILKFNRSNAVKVSESTL